MKRIDQFSNWFRGEWSNQRQAFSNPAVFANVLLTIESIEKYTFKLSQRYKQEQTPYRERILTVKQTGRNRFLLNTRKPDETEFLCNCHYEVEWDKERQCFKGSIEKSQCCEGNYNGKVYHLSAELELQENQLTTRDEGIDPSTNVHIWGQPMFPFVFDRLS